jgi:MFS family permease
MASTNAAYDVRPRDRMVAWTPVYYGWVMLPIAMIAQVATSPGQSFAIAVFNQSFTEAFRLSEQQLTGAFGLGTLLASLSLPLFGMLMDRTGIRWAMSLVVLLLGGACLFASQVSGLATLFFAFLLLRMFGQGALSLFAQNSLAMWFRQRLGTAVGIMSVGSVLLMGQLPVLIRALIEQVGWRTTYALLGVGVWAIMFPVLGLLFRNRPEDIGQSTDGKPPVSPERQSLQSDSVTSLDGYALSAAIRSRAYWIMFVLQSAWAMIGTALVFNIQKVFTSQGQTLDDAAWTLGRFFVAVAVMQLVGGVLADRVRLHWLITAAVAAMIVSLLLLLGGWNVSMAYVIFGMAQGLFGSAVSTLWPRYYGLAHAGRIRGSVMTAIVAGSAVGPFIMGVSFDWFGSYSPSLGMFVGIYAVLLFAAPFATPPAAKVSVEPGPPLPAVA